jgi:uncharacterized protein YndB with AHSA1/START domain
MTSATDEGLQDDGRLIRFERRLQAPRALVWKVWTQPEHFVRWFGPRDIAITHCTMDVRLGGIIRFTHEAQGERGFRLGVKGTFDDVTPPERLVIRFGFVDPSGNPIAPSFLPGWPLDAQLLTTATMVEQGDHTLLTVEQRVMPDDAITHPVVREERRGAREGWRQTLDRLEELLTVRTP